MKNNLEESVKVIIESHLKDYDNPDDFFDDLDENRCISGLIGELVYYTDTLKFYNNHKEEISVLVVEYTEQTRVFGLEDVLMGWDKLDPLTLEVNNQNLLAWFAFEQVALSLRDSYTEEGK